MQKNIKLGREMIITYYCRIIKIFLCFKCKRLKKIYRIHKNKFHRHIKTLRFILHCDKMFKNFNLFGER